MSENLKSKFIPILLILIIIAIAGWYVGAKTLSLKNQNSTPLNQNTNGSEQKWEAYVNEKYKYQFKFPAWHTKLNDESTDDHIVFSDDAQYWNIDLEIKDTDHSSIDEWIEQNQDKKIVSQQFISGYPTVITEYINKEGFSANDRVTAFIKGNKLFTIQTRIPKDELDLLLIGFAFIKDGRFLYHNEKYGYEFLYPLDMNGGSFTDNEISFGKSGESTEIGISSFIMSQDGPRTIEDYIKQDNYEKEKDIIIDNTPAVIVYDQHTGNAMKNIKHILIIHDKNYFSVSFMTLVGSNEEIEQKIESLISDFQNYFKFL